MRAQVAALIACAIAMALPLVAAGQRAPRPRPVKPPPAPPVVVEPDPPQVPSSLPGWPLYDRFCLPCHGVLGDGKGPGAPWLDPLPRDFTAGWFKWGRTSDATRPSRAGLADAIRWGAPGTAMHGFGATLTDADLDALVDVVSAFAGLSGDAGDYGAYGVYAFDAAGKARQIERGKALWASMGCPACHGAGGKGDGSSSAGLKDASGNASPPYDLTASVVRRPRAPDDGIEETILSSIAWGVGGTAMPAFAGAAPLEDLMAVSAYVASIGPAPAAAPPAPGEIGDVSAAAIARDRAGPARTVAGYRWGAVDDPDGALFGGVIHPQGEAPAALAPAQASLSSQQCGRCHAKQLREWTGTVHGAAASPGLMAQVLRIDDPKAVTSCLRCHAPLAEQQLDGAVLDPALQAEGLTCAACHVRANVRHGPAQRAPSLLPLPGYPLRELAVYERADFCVGCHQLPVRIALEGRPLLDTYREWLLGPYMKRGIQCQHCHMPNREHTWKGVHDPETFRQGIAVHATATRDRASIVSVKARIANVGAGHYLPTTPTPAAWLSTDLVDASGTDIPGTHKEVRIGRHLRFAKGRFEELADTRIPPGGHLDLASAWRGVSRATHVRVAVRVRPDDYYEGLYAARLRAKLDPSIRTMFQAALSRAQASAYVAHEQLFEINAP